MKRPCQILAASCAITAVISGLQVARAEITLIGPFPYSSAADSPFNLSGLGSTFFLEDFEDFDFDETPGVEDWSMGVGLGGSVDGDDGAVDGQSNGIGSAYVQQYLSSGSISASIFRLGFNAEDLGSYPTAFGMVFTRKDSSLGILASSLRVADYNGTVLASWDLRYALSLYSNGLDATDDIFIGIVSSEGLPIVLYEETFPAPPGSGISPGLPAGIDHVQYGLLVPEPPTIALGITTAFLIAVISRSFSRRRYGDITNDSSSLLVQKV